MVFKEECLPFWYDKNATEQKCPFGTKLPGDVTYPNDADWLDMLAVFWGFAPYIIVLLIFVEFCLKRGTRQLALLGFAGFCPGFNEFLVKPFIALPRPGFANMLTTDAGKIVGSCVYKCGMPSSHATISIGLWLLVVLEMAPRIVPASERMRKGRVPSFLADFGGGCRACADTPIMPRDKMTGSQFFGFLMLWTFLLVPVPLMRVRNYDHSIEQVLIGSTAGIVYALIWHQLMVTLSNRCVGSLGKYFCGFLVHNYVPAEFRVKVNGQPPQSDASIEQVAWTELQDTSEALNAELQSV